MGQEDPEPGKKTDKPQENPQKRSSEAAESWNDRAASRPEKQLSPQEQAERQKVEGLPGSIGRPFDRPPTEQNVRDWYNKLSPADKATLKNPETRVTLTCTASNTGDAGHNQTLTEKSGEAVKGILKDKLGVKADIKIEAVGADSTQPEQDNRFDRQVHVDIQSPEKSEPAVIKPAPVDGETIKGLTEPPTKPKEYDLDKEVLGRLKDIPDIVKGKIATTILKEIGKLAKVYFEGVHEWKQGSIRAAELVGVKNALFKTGTDLVDGGRGPHILEGKPYSVQELKDRLFPLERRDMINDAQNFSAKGSLQNLDNGFSKAVDALNQVLSQAHTPKERVAALESFRASILPRIQQQLDKTTAEQKDKHRLR